MSLLSLEVPDSEESVLVERYSRGQLVRRRFFRNKLAVFGLIVLGLMFVLAFIGPYFSKHKWDDSAQSTLVIKQSCKSNQQFESQNFG